MGQKGQLILTNFTAGEFTRLLDARVDFEKYSNACKELKNMVVHPHGPASRRPGFRYVAEAKYAGYNCKLVPFQYNTEQAYILEIGHKYMRVHMQDGQVIIEGSDLITNGGFAAATAPWDSGSAAALASAPAGAAGNCLQITEGGADNPYAWQFVSVEPGSLYELAFYLKQGTATAGMVKIVEADFNLPLTTGDLIVDNGYYEGGNINNWNVVVGGSFAASSSVYANEISPIGSRVAANDATSSDSRCAANITYYSGSEIDILAVGDWTRGLDTYTVGSDGTLTHKDTDNAIVKVTSIFDDTETSGYVLVCSDDSGASWGLGSCNIDGSGTITYRDGIDTNGNCRGITRVGDYLVACHSDGDIASYTIDETTGIFTLVDTLADPFSGGGTGRRVDTDGTYAYCCGTGSVASISVDSSGTLALVDEVTTPTATLDCAYYNGVLYFTDGASGIRWASVDSTGAFSGASSTDAGYTHEYCTLFVCPTTGDAHIVVSCGSSGIISYRIASDGSLEFVDFHDPGDSDSVCQYEQFLISAADAGGVDVYDASPGSMQVTVSAANDGARSDTFTTSNSIIYCFECDVFAYSDMQRLKVRIRKGDNSAYNLDEEFDGLVAGEWTHIKRMFREEDAAGAGTGGAGAYIEFLGHTDCAAGDYFFVDNVTMWDCSGSFLTGNLLVDESYTGTAAWVQHTKEFYTPMDCHGIIIGLFHEAANGDGTTLLYDTVELKRQDEPYEITANCDYLSGDVQDIQWTQSADIMVITHPSYIAKKVTRTAATPTFTMADWTYTAIDAGFTTFNSGVDDYAKCCLFFENRLGFACTNNNPIDIWLSEDGDLDDFQGAADDLRPINITFASDEVNEIQWLKAATNIIVGNSGAEWRVGSADEEDAIIYSNITAKEIQFIGSTWAMAAKVGQNVLFIQRHSKKIYRLAYNWESAGYVAPEMTVLAPHLTKSPVLAISYQKQPNSILWMPKQDGNMAGMTFHEEHEVTAMHDHETVGCFEDVATIPMGESDTSSDDQTWCLIKRSVTTTHGTFTKRYIEFLEEFFDDDSLINACFVDCAHTISVSAATYTISSPYLQALAGQSCKAMIGQGTIEDVTVGLDGSITTTAEIESFITIGHPYEHVITPMRVEPSIQGGTSQGRKKAFGECTLRLYKSNRGQYGQDGANMRDIPYKDARIGFGGYFSSVLYTGDVENVMVPGGVDYDGWITIKGSDPVPFTLVGIIFDMEVF